MKGARGLAWFKMDAQRFTNSMRVRTMSPAQVGVYTLLLCRQWLDGELPDDLDTLEVLAQCRTDQDREDLRSVLATCFEKGDGGGYVNPEQAEVLSDVLRKREKARRDGKKGARARWERSREPDRDPIATPKRPQSDPSGDPVAPRLPSPSTSQKEGSTFKGSATLSGVVVEVCRRIGKGGEWPLSSQTPEEWVETHAPSFPGVDLATEARACADWYESRDKRQASPTATLLNWWKKSLADVRRAPPAPEGETAEDFLGRLGFE